MRTVQIIVLLTLVFLKIEAVKSDTFLDALMRYAPLVYFHPYETYLPSSVADFRQFSTIYSANHEVIGPATNNLGNLSKHDYLSYESNELRGLPLENKHVIAPVYTHIKHYDDHPFIDIQYFFFYTYNGCVYFRVGYKHGFSQRKRNVPICNFGRHQGDWEHVTVRVDPHGEFMRLFVSQHGGGEWYAADQIQWYDTHPVIYPSLHSHANFVREEIRTQAELPISGIPFISSINWIKFVDVTSLNGTRRYPWMPQRDFSPVWRTWQHQQLKIVSGDEDWLQFKGYWGKKLDNRSPSQPPNMDGTVEKEIQFWAKAAIHLGFLDERYLQGRAPQTPSAKSLWRNPE